MVLVLWGVAAVPGNGNGIQGQNHVVMCRRSKRSAEFHYGNLIFGIQCFSLIAMNIYQWPNG